MLGILNIGYLEVLLIVGAAVLLFGGDLPDTARKVGRMVSKLRGTANELGRAFRDEAEPPTSLPPRLPPGHTKPTTASLPGPAGPAAPEVLDEHPPGADASSPDDREDNGVRRRPEDPSPN